ncbi:MAG: TonB-dependent receptor plug domain-containing protein, partial [Gammaproteobacteria bacterium]
MNFAHGVAEVLRVSVFMLLVTLVGPAFPDSEHVQELDNLIVSSPLQPASANTALPVAILSGDELRMKAASTIGETLQNEPGITSQSFGPGVGQPVIRGQSGPRVQVLQNSLGSSDVSSLSPDHANSTESLWAERIEVLKGPATLLYGSGAIGGIVNVLDNRIPDAIPEKGVQGA